MTFCEVGLWPAQWEESITGPTVDWGAGNAGHAVQMVGSVISGTTVAGKIEHSADGLVWFDMPGAAFATVQDSDRRESIPIATTLRYVRWNGTINVSNGGSAHVAVLFVRAGCS